MTEKLLRFAHNDSALVNGERLLRFARNYSAIIYICITSN
jgi:hypothetical protein